VLDTMLNLLSVDEALKQVLYGCIILALSWAYARGTASA
jgi:ribose/xylose/arabinose/galactoside ABC-type transport system permease subunit